MNGTAGLRNKHKRQRQRVSAAALVCVLVRLCLGEMFGWSVYTKDIRQRQERGIISMLAFICLIIGTQYLSQKYYLLFLFNLQMSTRKSDADTHASFEVEVEKNSNVQNNNYSFIKIHLLSLSTSYLIITIFNII